MLDQHTEKPFDRSVKRAVHHERLLARTILRDIFQIEALRQVEIELNGRKLPETANSVH